MTHVTYSDYRDTQEFECVGHTGYAPLGADILCSAVSCLCYTLDAYLSKAYDEGKIKSYSSDFRDGSVNVRFEYSEEYDSAAIREAVGAILYGFVLLEESFPEYIDADV